MYTFAELLRMYRGYKNISRVELARRLGVHRHTIKNWEEGEYLPETRDKVLAIAKELDLFPEDTDRLLKAAGFAPVEDFKSDDAIRLVSNPSPGLIPSQDIAGIQELIELLPHIQNLLSGGGLARIIPLQRQPKVDNFTGRENELDRLMDELRPGNIVTLFGPGGIGKSALASEAIHRISPGSKPPDRFPHGIVYCNFYRQPRADDALKHIAESFGEDPRLSSPRDAALRALSGRKVLLILDGTEEVDNLEKILFVCSQCGVIITTRSPYDCRGTVIEIFSLPLDKSVSLLQAIAGVWAEDVHVVYEICKFVEGMPLAVCIAGKAMAEAAVDASVYLAELKRIPQQALTRGAGIYQRDNFALVIERSLSQLSVSAIEVIKILSSISYAPIHRKSLAVAINSPESDIARHELLQLERYGLVFRQERFYQFSHSLIHKCIREKYHLSLLPEGAAIRLAAFYSHLSQAQINHGQEGYARLEREWRQIITTLLACVEHEIWSAVLDLQSVLDIYLQFQGNWMDRLLLCKAALLAAKRKRDQRLERDLSRKLGSTYYQLGNIQESRQQEERALAISEDLDDQRTTDLIRANLGTNLAQGEDVSAIIEANKERLEVAKGQGNLLAMWEYLSKLGFAHNQKKQKDQAFHYFRQALDIAEKVGHPNYVIHTLSMIASTYCESDQIDLAMTGFKLALKMAIDNDLTVIASNNFASLADTFNLLKQHQTAAQHYQMAIKLNPVEAFYYNNLGKTYLQLGEVDKAEYCFNRRVDLRPFDALAANVSLGVIALRRGNKNKAERHFKTALIAWEKAAERSINEPEVHLEYRALALLGLGREQEAISTLIDALAKSNPEDFRPENMDFTLYDLLAESPTPPDSLAEMRRLVEEKIQQ